MEPAAKKLRTEVEEAGKKKTSSDYPFPAVMLASDTPSRIVLQREHSTKPTAVMKPLSTTLSKQPSEEVVHEDVPKVPSIKELELAKWGTNTSIQKYLPAVGGDDAIIRRKLMFEAGNPPASSHRGIKLLAGNVSAFVGAVYDRKTVGELESMAERVQLCFRQEELTLTRLRVGGVAMRKIAEQDSKLPEQVLLDVQLVKTQISDQMKRLDFANKTESRFKDYVDFANNIRKLPSYEDLIKQRSVLREQTKKLKEERQALDRLQTQKQPYLLIANWALKRVRYDGEDHQPILAPPSAASQQHHSKSTTKHKKSPKKSSKEVKESRNPEKS